MWKLEPLPHTSASLNWQYSEHALGFPIDISDRALVSSGRVHLIITTHHPLVTKTVSTCLIKLPGRLKNQRGQRGIVMLLWVGASRRKKQMEKKRTFAVGEKKSEAKIYQETHISRSLKDCERTSMQLAVQKKKR
jgi:hypothetical protein